jgi:hypothetical protein
VQVREAESGAEFVVAEGGAETEGGQRRGGLARGFGYDVFAFGTFFVAGRFLRGWPVRGSFGCEDYSLAAAALRLAGGWGFDAQAQEHVAAAEVALGGVVEGVLFSDAGPGCGAQGFDLVFLDWGMGIVSVRLSEEVKRFNTEGTEERRRQI